MIFLYFECGKRIRIIFIVKYKKRGRGRRNKSTVIRTKAAHIYRQDTIKAFTWCTPSSSCSLLLLETVQEISLLCNAFTE